MKRWIQVIREVRIFRLKTNGCYTALDDLADRESDNMGVDVVDAMQSASIHLRTLHQLRLTLRRILEDEYRLCRSDDKEDLEYPRMVKARIDKLYISFIHTKPVPACVRWFVLDGFRVIRDEVLLYHSSKTHRIPTSQRSGLTPLRSG